MTWLKNKNRYKTVWPNFMTKKKPTVTQKHFIAYTSKSEIKEILFVVCFWRILWFLIFFCLKVFLTDCSSHSVVCVCFSIHFIAFVSRDELIEFDISTPHWLNSHSHSPITNRNYISTIIDKSIPKVYNSME